MTAEGMDLRAIRRCIPDCPRCGSRDLLIMITGKTIVHSTIICLSCGFHTDGSDIVTTARSWETAEVLS